MTPIRIRVFALPVLALVLTTAPAARPVIAGDIDTKGARDLVTAGERIDKRAGAAEGPGAVTTKIVGEWSGTRFTFEPGTEPRSLTAQDVQNLRTRGLGFGETSIVLALAAKQPDAVTAKSVTEILAMRHAGEGWGKIARELGYRNLGEVVSGVKKSEKAVEHAPKSERMHKVEKVEKPERLQRAERPERAERPGR